MKYPRILLTGIEHGNEDGHVNLRASIDGQPERIFCASYVRSKEKFVSSSVDEELFMLLSRLAVDRYCNATIYQFELMGILGAFVENRTIPPLPIELGTTDFGFKRPSIWKIGVDRFRRPFLLAWYSCKRVLGL